MRRLLARDWVLVIGLTLASAAWAETVPSIPSDPIITDPVITYKANSTWSSIWYESPNIVSACNSAIADRNAHTNYCGAAFLAYISPDPALNSSGYCYVTRSVCGDTLPGAIWAKIYTCQSPATLNVNTNKCQTPNYTCPVEGTWVLSADKQTCTGCSDLNKILDQDGYCVSPGEKSIGPECQNNAANSSWTE